MTSGSRSEIQWHRKLVEMHPSDPENRGLVRRRSESMNESTETRNDRGIVPPNPLSVVDRRCGIDRRDLEDAGTNLERRRGPGRRRTDFLRSAEEGEMTAEQFLFIQAIDTFKRVNGKTFPTWTDVLAVVRKLGYRKTMSSELTLPNQAADWTESPESPSGVDSMSEDAA